MTRGIAVRLAMVAALFWGQAHAIGLGEITLNSALNERLDAEIELLDTRGMQPNEIIAQLASSEDFARVGVERFFYLTEMRFKVEQRAGRTFLMVTSANPITEPYLNFLVQVMWPNGRLLKEYTVLLDPPAFSDRSAPAVAAPGRPDPGGGPAGRVARAPVRPDSQVSLAPRSTPPARSQQSRMQDGSYGVTDRDDTLWSIAARARPGEATVQQTMLAIVRLNPEAFIGGNVNLLKAGYVLRLPDEADVVSVDRADAIAAVAEHNQAWEAYRRGEALTAVGSDVSGDGTRRASSPLAGQVDATARRTASEPQGAIAEGELRILAGDSTGAGGATGGGTAQVEVLEAQLAATEEEVERVNRELADLAQQRDQVQAAAEQAKRQIEVRDQEIAQLQARLAAAQTQPQDAAAPAAGGTPSATEESAAGAPATDLKALLASPFALVGGGAVIVILLVASLIAMRRRRAAAQADDELPVFRPPSRRMATVSAAAAVAAPGAEESDETVPLVSSFERDPEDEDEVHAPAHAAAAGDAEEHEGAQTSDVIGEADIYIAYGRFPQAVNLLLGALEEDPNRSDVRLKLLEVYAETRDADGFQTQMSALEAHCDDNEMLLEARELEAKFRDDDAPTVVQTPARAREAAATSALSDDDFDLDLDRLGDEAIAEAASAAPDSGGSDDLGGDLGIDFDPDADDRTVIRTRGLAAAAAPRAKEVDDVAVMENGEPEFDLEDLELEDSAVAAKPGKPAAASERDNGDDAFDFLDEEDTASTKLDLARAYIDMGDNEGAREILAEVRDEGSTEQRKQADELLAKIG